ncbi:MAG TPA: histidine kinase [Chitinophagaceae bacterium]|nr:histidine kinase [Chitinophagaceae bacterium]
MNRVKLSRYWLFQLSGWGSFAFINSFFAYSFDKLNDAYDVQIFFGRLGIFVVLGILATHLMRFVIIRLNILQKSFDNQILQFLIVTFSFSFLVSFFYMQLLSKFGWLNKNEQEYLGKNVFLLILSGAFSFFLLLFIWNLIYFMYHYVTKSRKQQLDTLQLEALVKELELKTIKAHINPHFIFNALNSIRALIDENPDRARTAITELSNILRSSLKIEKGETISFNDELKIVKDYLALENMRFEDRLQVEYQVDDDTLDQQVPTMMLQTLVENAIKHGISKQIKGGVIKVISDIQENYHMLVVENTGRLTQSVSDELSPDNLMERGFGLSSTQDRLQLLYGDKARFEIRQLEDTIVQAKVLIPASTTKIKQTVINTQTQQLQTANYKF